MPADPSWKDPPAPRKCLPAPVVVVVITHDFFRRSCELQDVHAGAGAVGDVDEAAIVDLDVVGLDGVDHMVVPAGIREGASGAGRRPAQWSTTRVVWRGNEIADYPCFVRIANVPNPD